MRLRRILYFLQFDITFYRWPNWNYTIWICKNFFEIYESSVAKHNYLQVVEFLGRKRSLCLIALPQTLGWFLIIFARNSYYLIGSRLLAGFSGGALFVVLPQFITEIADDNIRGILGSCLVFTCNMGLVLGFISGVFLKYNEIPWVFLPLTAIFLVVLFRVPDTPISLMRTLKYKVWNTFYLKQSFE